jgi:hypothetical protein
MDMSVDMLEVSEPQGKGKRATVPKHNKNPANRLWTKWKRGDGKQKERDGGMNPDGAIDVATVCGSQVRTYREVKHGRVLSGIRDFSHRGAALVWAHEFEDFQRRPVAVVRVKRSASDLTD